MMKLGKNAKKSIIRNRVKLLTLDYFDVTAPLLATEILSTKKHKEIKAEASSNKGRVDLLLDWMEEHAPETAYPPFLQGIKNCDELLLARKMKKEAADGILGPLPKSLSLPKPPSVPATSTSVPLSTSEVPEKNAKPKKPKKLAVKVEPASVGIFSSAPPINGLPSDVSTPNSSPTKKSKPKSATKATPKSAGEKKTPGKSKSLENINGTPKNDLNDLGALIKKEKNIKQIAKKQVANSSLLPATPRATRKSSSSEKGEDAGGDAKPPKSKNKKEEGVNAPVGGTPKIKKPKVAGKSAGTVTANTAVNSPSKPKAPVRNAGGKAKPMTFKQVVDKQADFRQKFRFKNTDAVAKVIHFKDKTDISYLACPFEEGNNICERKVELKSKEFICEVKHKNPNCKQIPYLNLTCNDGTSDLQLTLMKEDVEAFCGKTATDLGALSVNEIKDSLDKTVGKKLSVEVSCERMTKGVKKGGSPIWKNLATILTDNDGPTPAKKKRKN